MIANTDEYDLCLNEFRHGIEAIEHTQYSILAGHPHSDAELSLETQASVFRAQALTGFLLRLCALVDAQTATTRAPAQRAENAWLSSQMTDLRLHCHRFSVASTRMVAALETDLYLKRSKARESLEEAGSASSTTTSTTSSRSCSMCGAPDWSRPCSPLGSTGSWTSSVGSDNVLSWGRRGEATVQNGEIKPGWSSSSGTSEGHPEHW